MAVDVNTLDVPLIQFGRQVRRPRRWYHTCSGEHAAILRGCREKGWNRAGYTLPTHQVFEAYMSQIRRFIGNDWTPLRIAKDGCGLPTVSNTVAELAQIYAGLVRIKMRIGYGKRWFVILILLVDLIVSILQF